MGREEEKGGKLQMGATERLRDSTFEDKIENTEFGISRSRGVHFSDAYSCIAIVPSIFCSCSCSRSCHCRGCWKVRGVSSQPWSRFRN